MNELKPNSEHEIEKSHQFLLGFIEKFHDAERGGIHDFIELSLSKMVNTSIRNIDEYLKEGDKNPDANEIMHIVTDSYQKVVDAMKRNLDAMKKVNFK
jgi:hypothetical protein